MSQAALCYYLSDYKICEKNQLVSLSEKEEIPNATKHLFEQILKSAMNYSYMKFRYFVDTLSCTTNYLKEAKFFGDKAF